LDNPQISPKISHVYLRFFLTSSGFFYLQAIYEYKITDKSLNAYFKDKLGRIRTVVLGPDKYLYILTSNTDGRGTLQEGDDKLIRIDPNIL